MPLRALEGVLLDFDGTISKGSVEAAIGLLHAAVTRWSPVPYAFVRQYVRAVTAFPTADVVRQLFAGLGLSEHAPRCLESFAEASSRDGPGVAIEADFPAFVQRCRGAGVAVKVLSAARSDEARFRPLFEWFDPRDLLSCAASPKAAPSTFAQVIRSLRGEPSRWLAVDDSPLALWSAKTAGLRTAMMINTVFTDADYRDGRDFIDLRIESFEELGRIVA